MQQFSDHVIGTWCAGGRFAPQPGQVSVVVDDRLPEARGVSLLHLVSGGAMLVLTSTRRDALGIDTPRIDGSALRERLATTGITLNDPDLLFFLPRDTIASLSGTPLPTGTRVLTADDAAAFEQFTRRAPEADLDEAFVELDHWLVVGTWDGDELVSVASAYPWRQGPLADIGVITLPQARGRGLGRRTVRAISAAVIDRGLEPQYRCQLDNAASVAVARASGFVPLGRWETLDD